MNPIQGGAPASYGPAPAASNAMNMQRPPVQFLELLDHLRTEYENIMNENKSYRGLREEYQRKVEEQVNELSSMEGAILELERKYRQMKDQYENEIRRLKGQAGIPTASAGPAAGAGQSGVKRGGAVAGAVAGSADASSQMAAQYPAPIPGVFGSAGVGTALSAHAQASQSLSNAANKFGSRMVAPQAQPAPPGRLMGIPSLPTAGGVTPGLHGVGGMSGTIPALTPGGPAASRAPPAKMHPMGMIPPTGTPPAGDVTALHQMKKEPGPAGPGNPPAIIGTQPGTGPFGPPGVRPTVVPSGFNQTLGQASQQEEDYVVYQGRSANNVVVNMKVGLQNSYDHDSVVCCVRYSWDGLFLATGSNRNAQIFESATGQRVAEFSKDDGSPADMDDTNAPDSYVRAVCFSPNGDWLVTGAEDHVVKVWDVSRRTVKHKLVGHDTDIYSVDSSANSRFIISGSGDKKAKLWCLETGKLLSTLGEEFGPTDGITSVSVSPTSQHVAAGSLDKVVRVWDVESGRMVRQFEGHSDSVYSVAFSPDGRMLLSGSLDKSLKLWDLAAAQPSSQCRLTFTGHKDFVLSVMFSPNGRWLISGSKDRTVQFWDPRQSSMALQLQGHKNSVISIAHNPTDNALATGSGDCSSRTWTYT